MVEDFVRLVEDTNLIYTTHSQYLVSPSHIKNAYVVARANGVVECVKWSDYIKGKKVNTTFYQPLYDCLQVVPNSHTIPWEKAIITEGPSDALILEMMREMLGLKPEEVVYPGTSASNLSTLISLNLGWDTKFSVLLDSDGAGIKEKKKYETAFSLDDGVIVLLPGSKTRIESMFTEGEKKALYELALEEKIDAVGKDDLLAAVRVIREQGKKLMPKSREVIGGDTKKKFAALFTELRKPLS